MERPFLLLIFIVFRAGYVLDSMLQVQAMRPPGPPGPLPQDEFTDRRNFISEVLRNDQCAYEPRPWCRTETRQHVNRQGSLDCRFAMAAFKELPMAERSPCLNVVGSGCVEGECHWVVEYPPPMQAPPNRPAGRGSLRRMSSMRQPPVRVWKSLRYCTVAVGRPLGHLGSRM
nr:PREDICTED: uncharacterized protein LOC109031280 [Bemisia tabaci]